MIHKKSVFRIRNILLQSKHAQQIVKVYFLFKNRFLTDFEDYWCTKLITYYY